MEFDVFEELLKNSYSASVPQKYRDDSLMQLNKFYQEVPVTAFSYLFRLIHETAESTLADQYATLIYSFVLHIPSLSLQENINDAIQIFMQSYIPIIKSETIESISKERISYAFGRIIANQIQLNSNHLSNIKFIFSCFKKVEPADYPILVLSELLSRCQVSILSEDLLKSVFGYESSYITRIRYLSSVIIHTESDTIHQIFDELISQMPAEHISESFKILSGIAERNSDFFEPHFLSIVSIACDVINQYGENIKIYGLYFLLALIENATVLCTKDGVDELFFDTAFNILQSITEDFPIKPDNDGCSYSLSVSIISAIFQKMPSENIFSHLFEITKLISLESTVEFVAAVFNSVSQIKIIKSFFFEATLPLFTLVRDLCYDLLGCESSRVRYFAWKAMRPTVRIDPNDNLIITKDTFLALLELSIVEQEPVVRKAAVKTIQKIIPFIFLYRINTTTDELTDIINNQFEVVDEVSNDEEIFIQQISILKSCLENLKLASIPNKAEFAFRTLDIVSIIADETHIEPIELGAIALEILEREEVDESVLGKSIVDAGNQFDLVKKMSQNESFSIKDQTRIKKALGMYVNSLFKLDDNFSDNASETLSLLLSQLNEFPEISEYDDANEIDTAPVEKVRNSFNRNYYIEKTIVEDYKNLFSLVKHIIWKIRNVDDYVETILDIIQKFINENLIIDRIAFEALSVYVILINNIEQNTFFEYLFSFLKLLITSNMNSLCFPSTIAVINFTLKNMRIEDETLRNQNSQNLLSYFSKAMSILIPKLIAEKEIFAQCEAHRYYHDDILNSLCDAFKKSSECVSSAILVSPNCVKEIYESTLFNLIDDFPEDQDPIFYKAHRNLFKVMYIRCIVDSYEQILVSIELLEEVLDFAMIMLEEEEDDSVLDSSEFIAEIANQITYIVIDHGDIINPEVCRAFFEKLKSMIGTELEEIDTAIQSLMAAIMLIDFNSFINPEDAFYIVEFLNRDFSLTTGICSILPFEFTVKCLVSGYPFDPFQSANIPYLLFSENDNCEFPEEAYNQLMVESVRFLLEQKNDHFLKIISNPKTDQNYVQFIQQIMGHLQED